MKPEYLLPQPVLCLVVGVAASGKTVLAKSMASICHDCALLSKDLIEDAFTTTERSGELYEMIYGPTYEILVNFAALQLSIGKTPILDAPFSFNHRRADQYKEWVELFHSVSERHSVRLAIIRCLPPDLEILKNRLSRRGRYYDAWKLDNWEQWLEKEPIRFPILHDDVHEVVSDTPPQSLAAQVLTNFLEAHRVRQ